MDTVCSPPKNSAAPYNGVVAGGRQQQSVPLLENISFYREIFHSSLQEYSLLKFPSSSYNVFLAETSGGGSKAACKLAALKTVWSIFDEAGLLLFESITLHDILTY